MEEEWRSIRGWSEYYVSNLGVIYSVRLDRPLRAAPEKTYPRVTLCQDGRRQSFAVHVLVAIEFVPGEFEGGLVNHIDGNKQNPRADNLEWTTYAGNLRHAIENDLFPTRRRWEVTPEMRANNQSPRRIR